MIDTEDIDELGNLLIMENRIIIENDTSEDWTEIDNQNIIPRQKIY